MKVLKVSSDTTRERWVEVGINLSLVDAFDRDTDRHNEMTKQNSGERKGSQTKKVIDGDECQKKTIINMKRRRWIRRMDTNAEEKCR